MCSSEALQYGLMVFWYNGYKVSRLVDKVTVESKRHWIFLNVPAKIVTLLIINGILLCFHVAHFLF